MPLVYLDFETASEVDLTKVGGWNYANHPSTFILCMCIRTETDKTYTWTDPGYLDSGDIWRFAENPDVTFVAHNAYFDRAIWEAIMVKKYDYPEIPISRWKCTMAKALSYGLPAGLNECAEALGFEGKDQHGAAMMKTLSKPRKATKDNKDKWWAPETAPGAFKSLYNYCLQDIEVMINVDRRLRDLSARETRIWQIDQRINSEGVLLDLPLIEKMQEFRAENETNLLKEFKELTEGYCSSPRQGAALIKWFKSQGVTITNTRAATLRGIKSDNEKVKRVVKIRQELSKTSLAKLDAMQKRCDGEGRIRELFQYHGAHTGRWAGRGVQLQNLKRSPKNMEDIVHDIQRHDFDTFSWLYGDINDPLSRCIRGCLSPARTSRFLICDFAQMEARVLAWLSGDKNKLDMFRNGVDVYLVAASTIYGRTVTAEDKDERQLGKVSELALGYGGGIAAFAKMATSHELDLTPVFRPLWATTTPDERKKAEKSYLLYMKKWQEQKKKGKQKEDEPVTREVGYTADVIKQRWRIANPHIVNYWGKLELLYKQVVSSKRPTREGQLVGFYDGVDFTIRLPSGRLFRYSGMAMGEKDGKLSYWGKDQETGRRVRTHLYGGKIAENITQAVQRDLLSEAMDLLEPHWPTVLHVHDELVFEVPADYADDKIKKSIEYSMIHGRKWTEGLPVNVDAFYAERYRK